MKITEQLLIELGARKIEGNWYIELCTGEYQRDMYFTKDEGKWKFYTSIDNPAYYYVIDLVECFGYIADDSYQSGKNAKIAEIRRALNV